MVSSASFMTPPRWGVCNSDDWTVLSSSMTDAMAVLKWKRSSISSVTFLMVLCTARRRVRSSAVSVAKSGAAAVLHQVEPVMDQFPYAVEKTERAVNPLVAPVQILFRRRRKQGKEAGRIGAVTLDEGIGIDHVTLGLAHLGAILDDHALGQQVGEGLVAGYVSQVAQYLGKEAGIQKMQDGMLDTADILVNGHPVIHPFAVQRAVLEVGAAIAQEIPGRLDKGVHGVGFAPRRLAAQGTGAVDKGIQLGQRTAPFPAELHVHGKPHRQILFRDRHHAAAVAVDHRNGIAPVALTGDPPIAQAEIDRLLADPLLLQIIGDGLLGCIALQAVEAARVDQRSRPR